jgi:hypothetical protein
VPHRDQGVVKGAANVAAHFVSFAPMARGNRHLTLNTILHDGAGAHAAANGAPAPRTARASSYRLLHRASSPPVLLASGTIEDELAWCEEERRWRFSRREFVMDPPAAAGGVQQRVVEQQ